MLALLVVLICTILAVEFVLDHYEFISPAFIFTVSFLVASIWALAYQTKWNLNLSLITFAVVLGGVFEFFLISKLIGFMYELLRGYSSNISGLEETQATNKYGLLVILFIEILTAVYTVWVVRKIMPAGSVVESISLYRGAVLASMTGTKITALPHLLNILRNFSTASGYFCAYLLAQDLVYRKRKNYLLLGITVFAIFNGLLLGGRGGALNLFIAFVVYWYCILKRKQNWLSHGNVKILIGAVFGLIVLVFSFQWLASVLGRDVDQYSTMDYLAIYFGAEIKNLDTFLTNQIYPVHTGVPGGQTFYYLIKAASGYLHLGIPDYDFMLPFQSVNGYNLGNVYTTFYPYIYDFGMSGLLVLVGIMATVSQLIFESVKHFNGKKMISFSTLIYGYIVTALGFSFFSNKFYENIFSVNLLQMLVTWFLLYILFFRVKWTLKLHSKQNL